MSAACRVVADAVSLAICAAELVAAVAREAVAARGVCTLALSGGKTPRLLLEELSRLVGMPWRQIFLYWGDERLVPAEHGDSNYRLAREALLDRLPEKPALVCPVDTAVASPEEAAAADAAALAATFPAAARENGWPLFDCILLGLGADGHTASLFPGNTALKETDRWTAVGQAPDGSRRVTLTLPVLCAARQVIFLVSGQEKAAAVAAVAAGKATHLPAALVRAKTVTWLLDAAAASQLPKR